MMSITELQEILPQEYPFLLIDRVLDFQEDKRIVAIKNVTVNEHFFVGHFPGRPIMPGVLILEAMAQTAIVLYARSKHALKSNTRYLFGKADIRFRAPVVPGDQLRFEVEAEKMLANAAMVKAQAFVEKTLVAEAVLGFSVQKLDDKK